MANVNIWENIADKWKIWSIMVWGGVQKAEVTRCSHMADRRVRQKERIASVQDLPSVSVANVVETAISELDYIVSSKCTV